VSEMMAGHDINHLNQVRQLLVSTRSASGKGKK
jgi:hypothetical protein